MIKKRITIYFEEELVKMLKPRATRTNQSVSEYINQVVYRDLLEEQEDLEDIQRILKEPTVPFNKVLKQLKIKNDVHD